jgi:hypothetical protein
METHASHDQRKLFRRLQSPVSFGGFRVKPLKHLLHCLLSVLVQAFVLEADEVNLDCLHGFHVLEQANVNGVVDYFAQLTQSLGQVGENCYLFSLLKTLSVHADPVYDLEQLLVLLVEGHLLLFC